jgi:hypothetical protein
MSWQALGMALIPFGIYGLGWIHGYVNGKHTGITEELNRKAIR